MNGKMERMWKEAVVAIPVFAWRDWGNHENISVRIAGLQADIWSWDIPNMKQEC
jgi:hypothetical protein